MYILLMTLFLQTGEYETNFIKYTETKEQCIAEAKNLSIRASRELNKSENESLRKEIVELRIECNKYDKQEVSI